MQGAEEAKARAADQGPDGHGSVMRMFTKTVFLFVKVNFLFVKAYILGRKYHDRKRV
jgi:hypothetical protein